jgi:hypothetical protein
MINDEDGRLTLLSGGDQLFQVLHTELQERLARAGVNVEEARLTHLAYAPEIAQAMLSRQQAEAVIGARTKIVHGAVSMVEMALAQLQKRGIIDFDPERKAWSVICWWCFAANPTPNRSSTQVRFTIEDRWLTENRSYCESTKSSGATWTNGHRKSFGA